ncbi:arylamine N-acetyltransferase family protein [Sphingobium nicotianae]|uniref:Arylamine N-acetyltransferase n=1 Tax=Sphingobium nicotianae TaxID=2782607 RepID=A0A9X1DD78_9SPHN|nr:arylamine N-acetyltransferase [Sphingobium nicotianae]MBT2187901.1 arylamine N-acetyltransferase [Sphingobium nicotianae]
MTGSDRLAAYLRHLGLDAPPSPDAEGLADLQAAHRQSIAFANLDLRLGNPVRIDSDAAFDKLVTRRRGGYCFEQNRVFSDMLAALGMPNRPLLARVRLGLPPDAPAQPRTHVLLLVDLDGEPWIADAGFGASYVPPLPLIDGVTVTSDDGASHRLRRIGAPGDLGGEWLFERAGLVSDNRAKPDADWQPQYAFDLLPVAADDLEQCNHWTSTRPGTRFLSMHLVSIALPDGFASMTDSTLTVYRGQAKEVRVIDDLGDYQAVLSDLFSLALSPEEVAALPLTQPERL